jgi:hypothetical protein
MHRSSSPGAAASCTGGLNLSHVPTRDCGMHVQRKHQARATLEGPHADGHPLSCDSTMPTGRLPSRTCNLGASPWSAATTSGVHRTPRTATAARRRRVRCPKCAREDSDSGGVRTPCVAIISSKLTRRVEVRVKTSPTWGLSEHCRAPSLDASVQPSPRSYPSPRGTLSRSGGGWCPPVTAADNYGCVGRYTRSMSSG